MGNFFLFADGEVLGGIEFFHDMDGAAVGEDGHKEK